jgi:hypothetical protein
MRAKKPPVCVGIALLRTAASTKWYLLAILVCSSANMQAAALHRVPCRNLFYIL